MWLHFGSNSVNTGNFADKDQAILALEIYPNCRILVPAGSYGCETTQQESIGRQIR